MNPWDIVGKEGDELQCSLMRLHKAKFDVVSYGEGVSGRSVGGDKIFGLSLSFRL